MKERVKKFYADHKAEIILTIATTAISSTVSYYVAKGRFEVVRVEVYQNEAMNDAHVKMWRKNGTATMPKVTPIQYD